MADEQEAGAEEAEVLVLGEEPEDQEDDIEIPTFADDGEDQADDPGLVKHLREQIRERDKRLADAEKAKAPATKIEVGPEPEWGDVGDEWEYDGKKFADAHAAWEKRRAAANAEGDAVRDAEQKRQADVAKLVTTYQEKRATVRGVDMDDAESTVFSALSDPQKELLLRLSGDPAKLVAALASSPAKLAALSGVKVHDMASVGAFSFALAQIDGKIKMAARKPKAAIDRPVRGDGSIASEAGADQKKLDKLLDAGRFTEYRALRKSLDEKARASA